MINENFDSLQEDEDAQKEREFVKGIANHEEYPLVIRDLRKVYPAIGGRPEHVAVKNLSLESTQLQRATLGLQGMISGIILNLSIWAWECAHSLISFGLTWLWRSICYSTPDLKEYLQWRRNKKLHLQWKKCILNRKQTIVQVNSREGWRDVYL